MLHTIQKTSYKKHVLSFHKKKVRVSRKKGYDTNCYFFLRVFRKKGIRYSQGYFFRTIRFFFFARYVFLYLSFPSHDTFSAFQLARIFSHGKRHRRDNRLFCSNRKETFLQIWFAEIGCFLLTSNFALFQQQGVFFRVMSPCCWNKASLLAHPFLCEKKQNRRKKSKINGEKNLWKKLEVYEKKSF